ncbi:MAG: DHHA1 domain-containing protein [Methanimicrococcus sp.]|nr:DHHA1 domain-containing protein [Methanimicrococcus sp.]
MVNYNAMPESERIRHLKKHAESAARLIKQHSYIGLVTHNDSDGLSSAAIMIQAFKREGITYYHKIVPRLDEGIVASIASAYPEDFLLVFCDIGSGQGDILSVLPNPIVILDHHVPVGKSPAKAVVNPMLVGLEGSNMISGAGVSYLTARAMRPENVDLSSLAVTGMIGDRQLIIAANAVILEEAVSSGAVAVRRGLKVGDGSLLDVFMKTTEPYLDITGKPDAICSFLEDLKLDAGKNIRDLTEGEMNRLCQAVLSKLDQIHCPDAIEAAVGDVYYLKNQLVENVFDLAGILDSCVKDEDFDAAIALCLGDETVLNRAYEFYKVNQETLIRNLSEALPLAASLSNLSYIYGSDLQSSGSISTTYVRYVDPSKPFVCLNERESIIRISARATRDLIQKGLDLSISVREASASVGGVGGGHKIASGGVLPIGTKDAFLEKLNELVGIQLASAKEKSSLHISGCIRFIDETDAEKENHHAEKLAVSLAPDNLYGTETKVEDGYVEICLSSDKIGSLLATADDLLMNADGAVRVTKASQKSRETEN